MALARPLAPQISATPAAPAPARRGRPRLRVSSAPQRVSGPPVMRLAPGAARTSAPVQVEGLVNNPRPGAPLPEGVRATLERSFDYDLGDVRVHAEPEAASVVDSLGTRAFAYGTHIFLGKGERPTDVGLMAHEVAHVVQQQGTPLLQTYSSIGNDRFEHEAHRAASIAALNGHAAVKERTGGPRVQRLRIPVISDAVDWLKDRVWGLVERVSPELARILRGGVLNWLKEKLSSAVQAVVDTITAPVRAVGDAVSGVRRHFTNMIGWLREAASKIARNDCGPIQEAADKIHDVFMGVAAPVVERVKLFAGRVKEFFQGLWNRFGAPVWNLLKRIGGAIWEQIERIGRWIWEKTQPVRDWLARAWRWLKNFIGIGEGEEGQNGILQWFQRKASAAWDWVMERIAPFKRQLLIVAAVLVMLSPAGPLIAIAAAAAGILRGIQWIRQNMRSRNAVVQQRNTLRDTILPAILSAIGAVSALVNRIAGGITGALGRAVGGLESLSSAIGGIPLLSFARGLFDWIAGGFRGLLEWAIAGVQGLAGWLQGGLQRLDGFARLLVDALEEIGRVVGNFFRLTGGMFRRIWNAIPKCIRDPFVDWFIPLILRHIPFFSELAATPEAWQQTKAQVNTLLVQVFVNFDLIGAMKTVFRLVVRVLRIPVDLVVQLLDKASQAWDLVLARPMRFIENALKTILRGIGRFMSRILSHLWFGVQGWLLNSVGDASITLPSGLTDWRGWLNLVLGILGLSVDHVIDLIDRRFPGAGRRLRQALNFLTGALEWLRVALTEGPAGIWRLLMERLRDLGNAVIEGAVGWVMERIIAIISGRLTALAASAGLSAILEAVWAVWQAVQTALEYARRILQMLINVFDAIIQIANGVIEPAAEKLEQAWRNAMPVVIGFLANYAGLGGIGKYIREIIGKVRQKVDNAILGLIDAARAAIQRVLGAIRSGVQAVVDWWRQRHAFRGADGRPHEVYYTGSQSAPRLMVASDAPMGVREFLATVRQRPQVTQATLDKVDTAERLMTRLDGVVRGQESTEAKSRTIGQILASLAVPLGQLKGIDTAIPLTRVTWSAPGDLGTRVTAQPLTMNPGNTRGSSRPTATPPGWARAQRVNAALPGSAVLWVRAHLLSYRFHGPGDAIWNLVPATQGANSQMTGVENDISAALAENNGRNVLWFTAEVDYRSGSYRNFPMRITTAFGRMNGERRGARLGGVTAPVAAPTIGLSSASINEWGREVLEEVGEISERAATYLTYARNDGSGRLTRVNYERRLQEQGLGEDSIESIRQAVRAGRLTF